MRIFTGLNEAHKEIERDLFEMGSVVPSGSVQDIVVKNNPDYDMFEITGYGYKITKFTDIAQFIHAQALNERWLIREFEERTGGQNLNPGAAWKLRESTWAPFLHEGRFSYTYPERISNGQQLERIIDELQRNPTSRQCIISIYHPRDIVNMGGKQRVPCSLQYQIMIRNNALDLHYLQRSADFMLHFRYDVVLAIMMLEHLALRLRVLPGIFHHYVTSLHAFRKDLPPNIF